MSPPPYLYLDCYLHQLSIVAPAISNSLLFSWLSCLLFFYLESHLPFCVHESPSLPSWCYLRIFVLLYLSQYILHDWLTSLFSPSDCHIWPCKFFPFKTVGNTDHMIEYMNCQCDSSAYINSINNSTCYLLSRSNVVPLSTHFICMTKSWREHYSYLQFMDEKT